MNLLAYRVSLPDGDEELSYTQAINTAIFPPHCFANILQIQSTHQKFRWVRLPLVLTVLAGFSLGIQPYASFVPYVE